MGATRNTVRLEPIGEPTLREFVMRRDAEDGPESIEAQTSNGGRSGGTEA